MLNAEGCVRWTDSVDTGSVYFGGLQAGQSASFPIGTL